MVQLKNVRDRIFKETGFEITFGRSNNLKNMMPGVEHPEQGSTKK